MPYTYTIAREAVNGMPIIRAMFLDDPNDYTFGNATQYQYMFGPNMLIAPIYKNTEMDKDGNDIRNEIYLPEGKWVDYWNGDIYEGGRLINNYPAPLWKIPVFVKSDAIIPMTNPNNNPSQIRKDYRAYEIYVNNKAFFSEYDDDGTTQAYLNGQCTRTQVSAQTRKGKLIVTIEPTIGNFSGFEALKETELRINVSCAPKKVTAKIGKRTIKLDQSSNLDDYKKSSDVFFYDSAPNLNRFSTPGSSAEIISIRKNPQLLIKIRKTDVTAEALAVQVDGFAYKPADRLRTHGGTLEAPMARIAEECRTPFTLTPSWEKVSNADFYEIEFDGMLYSTITENKFNIGGLEAETAYTMKVRAVNKDGYSAWTSLSASTKSNPLEFAIKGIKAQATCEDQPGTGIDHLFDFDTKSQWHSKWGKGEAIPCDLTIDLRSVNKLDRLDYVPREDGGNGTILAGTISTSSNRVKWAEPVAFAWPKDSATKTFSFKENPEARYVRVHIDEAIGNFASGSEMYVFKVPGSESWFQGDINHDKRIDENDLTSYMNYTGLRKGDRDFDYVSAGDINNNGLIDSYDISCVATELDGGVRNSNECVSGSLVLTPNKIMYAAGDQVEITISGKNMHYVNALSFSLPYSTNELEYMGMELIDMKEMINLTYDRLHTNGQKALYPTFVNRGNNFLLEEGDCDLFVIKFCAKKAGNFNLKATDGLLVDRNLGIATF